MEAGHVMINPESIYYLFEVGQKIKQEDYIWPVPGKASENDRVYIVCDGAGSFDNGGVASKLICQFMAGNVLKFGEHKMSRELIDRLLMEARDRLILYAREYRLDTDLTTTFSMLILYDQKVFMSWCGDSRIYHLRGGEILFKTEDNSRVSEPTKNVTISRGIKADSSPIYAETKWIDYVRDGDYFLICSKSIIENVTDDDIRLLVSPNGKTNNDLTSSFKKLFFEKTPENYSMYLLKVNVGKQNESRNSRIDTIRKQANRFARPIFFIIATIIIGLLIMIFYFRKTSYPAPKYTNQTTQPVHDSRKDSVPGKIVMSAPKPVDISHEDSASNAIDISASRKSILSATDSAKNVSENPPEDLTSDSSAVIQAEERREHTNQTPTIQKKQVAQLLIKFTTDESCKLKITNLDLDEVIDWDLFQNDNGTLYLKPGKYSIVAKSVVDGSKTKTYNFDVKPGYSHTMQNLHISFR
jgi:PPM family protein phosphatase